MKIENLIFMILCKCKYSEKYLKISKIIVRIFLLFFLKKTFRCYLLTKCSTFS